MKWGTPDHPKMSHLCGVLSIGVAQAVGHLELLWHWTAKYRPDGSLEGLSDHTIAAACRWPGDASPFVRALEAARWLDVAPVRRVHDWSEHAENVVHTKLAEARMLFCDGVVPKTAGLDSRERDRAKRDLAEAVARREAEATLPMEPPRSPHGDPKETPRLAVAFAVASETTNRTTATSARTPAQGSLPVGLVAVNSRSQPIENVEALRKNIEEIVEIDGVSFDRAAIFVTSGQVNGRAVCKGTLSFETMSDKHMRRSILDSNTYLSRRQRSA